MSVLSIAPTIQDEVRHHIAERVEGDLMLHTDNLYPLAVTQQQTLFSVKLIITHTRGRGRGRIISLYNRTIYSTIIIYISLIRYFTVTGFFRIGFFPYR